MLINSFVFIRKPGGKIRVIMARAMDDNEKQRYRKAKKGEISKWVK